MQTNSAPGDGLEIPAFLKVTPEESARRVAYNAAHPIAAVQFTPQREVSAEAQAILDRLDEERRAAEKVKRDNRKTHKELVATQDRAISDGKVWRNGQWVDPEAMAHSKACRIMRDLPNDSYRATFVKLFGDNIVGGVPKLKNGIWK